MIKYDKTEISRKSNQELLKDLFESNFHNETYIAIIIEILFERGITTSTIFEGYKTDDLVVIYCFDRKKHKIPFIALVKDELLYRNYDLSSIPDIESNTHFERPSKKVDITETPEAPRFNNSDTQDNYEEDSSKQNFGKYIGAAIALVVIVSLKMFIKFGADNPDKRQNDIELSNQKNEENNFKNNEIAYDQFYVDPLKCKLGKDVMIKLANKSTDEKRSIVNAWLIGKNNGIGEEVNESLQTLETFLRDEYSDGGFDFDDLKEKFLKTYNEGYTFPSELNEYKVLLIDEINKRLENLCKKYSQKMEVK